MRASASACGAHPTDKVAHLDFIAHLHIYTIKVTISCPKSETMINFDKTSVTRAWSSKSDHARAGGYDWCSVIRSHVHSSVKGRATIEGVCAKSVSGGFAERNADRLTEWERVDYVLIIVGFFHARSNLHNTV